MRMGRALVDLQLRDLLPAERAARKHVEHRVADDRLGMLRQLLGERNLALASGISGEALVELLLRLLPREPDLVGVEDDDEVARVEERRVDGLVLAHQDHRDLGRETAQDLVLRVDHEPFLLQGLGAGDERLLLCASHMRRGNIETKTKRVKGEMSGPESKLPP